MPAEEDAQIDRALILTKLSRLSQYLGYLKSLQLSSLEEFKGDFRISGATQRYLQVAIECMIGIGNEIIASLQLRRPERYRDIPEILSEAKIIPRDLAEAMASMIGLRNLLVHDYASINLDLIYNFLRSRLGDFEAFMKSIAGWLMKASGAA
jgi:uncharacterized protein YutE (UPF0331/DUF86 family)